MLYRSPIAATTTSVDYARYASSVAVILGGISGYNVVNQLQNANLELATLLWSESRQIWENAAEELHVRHFRRTQSAVNTSCIRHRAGGLAFRLDSFRAPRFVGCWVMIHGQCQRMWMRVRMVVQRRWCAMSTIAVDELRARLGQLHIWNEVFHAIRTSGIASGR